MCGKSQVGRKSHGLFSENRYTGKQRECEIRFDGGWEWKEEEKQMFQTLEQDRSYLENKYHRTDEPFDPFARMRYHGYEYDASTGLNDLEIRKGLEELYASVQDQPHALIKAKAFAYVLDHMRIDVNAQDYFVGFYTWGHPLYFIQELWQQEFLRKSGADAEETAQKKRLQQMEKDCNASGAITMWPDFDHVVPDWNALLRLGFPGLKERVVRYHAKHRANGTLCSESDALFAGMEIELSAILRILDRLHRYALAHPCEKTAVVAPCLQRLATGVPETTYDALMAIYIYFMLIEHIDNYQARSLGNGLDQTLYPFYQRDLQSGRHSREEIKEFLAYFMMQFSAIGNYWGHPFYLGGTNRKGETLVNDLSYDILEVYGQLGIYNPKIQMKVAENTPKEFLEKALSRVRDGNGNFVFCCEPGFRKALMCYGASLEEATDFEISGCYETRVRAKEVSTASHYLNFAKAVLYALFDGYDTTAQKQIGCHTGTPADLPTFEDFYTAFLKQLDFMIELCFAIGNRLYDPMLSSINPSLLYTATIEGALQKGLDAYARGSQYNNSCILSCGFATAVDSLLAVKEMVYEQHLLTLQTLRKALQKNWQGFERIRAKILCSGKKYGNADPETNAYAAAIARHYATKIDLTPNARGGVYKALMHSARTFLTAGKRTGATPDGRLAGEELSKNASPSVGMDREGVTALIHAALQAAPSLCLEGYNVDLMIHPSAVAGEDGLAVMIALLQTYLRGGGMAMQFNIFSAQMLKDAQAHPEKYRNLQVRVCGWNVLWNNLSREEQNAYLKRAENIRDI